MFYSESLLAKTGPLARVWLAANLEKKLTKQSILQSDIDNNVKDIIGTGQAPMALRLSGQLLLGVVRIYNRKAKYLFDDCSEALGRLKMAFRPGNVDLPAHQLIANNPNALTLQDRITEQDLFAPLPDPDDWLRSPGGAMFGGNDNDLNFGDEPLLDTQMTPSSQRNREVIGGLEEDLDFNVPFDTEPSIEIGRKAATPRDDRTSMMLEDDLGIFGDTTSGFDNDIIMGDIDGPTKSNGAEPTANRSDSPLAARDDTFGLNGTAIEEIDETAVQAAQRVKRRKVLEQDLRTELENEEMKHLQEDRSTITKPPSLLPHDPVLLQLMEMQRSGAFVSNILGDGRMAGWAPQLRGILSIEVVRKVGERKRKRDSGIAAVENSSDRVVSSPRLDLPEDGNDPTMYEDHQPFGDDDGVQIEGDNTEGGLSRRERDFDDTEIPLVHPSLSGPVSVGTKTAVAALRHHLAPGHRGTEPPTPSKRTRAEVKFTELCPVKTTNRADATKMFFELLVLGTKDAVKIEQEKKSGLSGEIRVRGKRGLWGTWAEMEESQDTAAVVTA